MMREEFPVPDEVIVDPVSGFAINMPLGPQDYPGWQKDRPEVVRRIADLRRASGIEVEDDIFVDKLVEGQPRARSGRKAPLPTARRRKDG